MTANRVANKRENGELNVANRTLFVCDNIGVLDGINSACVDLIYLDPPFNSNRNYSAPIGSKAAGAAFKDAWTLDDIDLAWVGQIAERHPSLAAVINAAGLAGGKGDKAYLVFMARRLLEMHRILKPTGSIYLHCDPTMSHSLKMLMDSIFGKKQFRNEVVWSYRRWAGRAKKFQSMHDVLLFYGKSGDYVWNWPKEPKSPGTPHYKRWNVADKDGKLKTFADKSVAVSETNMRDVWEVSWLQSQSKERTGYPTQKPLALLQRIIKASSDEGDVVLDPFCGCATAMVAAEMLGRRWIGADISPMATNLIQARLQNAQDILTTKGAWKKISVREDLPVRTDEGDLTVNPKIYSHELYGMQDGKCAGCRHEFPFRNLTVDHKESREQGGRDIKPNLQLLCGWCNSVKGTRPMAYLLARLKEAGII